MRPWKCNVYAYGTVHIFLVLTAPAMNGWPGWVNLADYWWVVGVSHWVDGWAVSTCEFSCM